MPLFTQLVARISSCHLPYEVFAKYVFCPRGLQLHCCVCVPWSETNATFVTGGTQTYSIVISVLSESTFVENNALHPEQATKPLTDLIVVIYDSDVMVEMFGPMMLCGQ